MNQSAGAVDLESFLALPWSPGVRQKLRERASQSDTQAIAAWDHNGRLVASAYTTLPERWPESLVALWRKQTFQPTEPEPVKSKTMQALDLILQDGLTPFAAAKQVGVHASAVYRALERAEKKPICPCCGQVVREGFELDRSVLKDPAAGSAGA
jgi:hypothetical protein